MTVVSWYNQPSLTVTKNKTCTSFESHGDCYDFDFIPGDAYLTTGRIRLAALPSMEHYITVMLASNGKNGVDHTGVGFLLNGRSTYPTLFRGGHTEKCNILSQTNTVCAEFLPGILGMEFTLVCSTYMVDSTLVVEGSWNSTIKSGQTGYTFFTTSIPNWSHEDQIGHGIGLYSRTKSLPFKVDFAWLKTQDHPGL